MQPCLPIICCLNSAHWLGVFSWCLRFASYSCVFCGGGGGALKCENWCFLCGNLLVKATFVVKVARLQSEFCTKDFFSGYEISYEKCSEIFPESSEPLFCGSEKIPENSLQISHQIFQNSLRTIKKKSLTSFCRSAGTICCELSLLDVSDS